MTTKRFGFQTFSHILHPRKTHPAKRLICNVMQFNQYFIQSQIGVEYS